MVGAVDKHLALIGFMGAGKTTIGRELARLTHRPFVDTDEEIEKRFGPIGELFERGEPEFRRIEEQVVAEGGIYTTPLLPGFELPLNQLLKVADDWEKKRQPPVKGDSPAGA